MMSLKDIIGFNKRKRVIAPIQLNRGRKVRTPVPQWGTSVRVNDPPQHFDKLSVLSEIEE